MKKTHKIVSLITALTLSASAFAGLAVVNADELDAASLMPSGIIDELHDKFVGSDAELETEAVGDVLLEKIDFNDQEVADIADGTETSEATATVGALKVTTTNRERSSGAGDRGWYTDSAGTLVKTGSYFAIEAKDPTDKYLHMSMPIFGDYGTQGRWAHVDFMDGDAVKTYKATNDESIELEFDAKFIDGMKGGKAYAELKDNDKLVCTPVLRIGTFNANAKTANAAAIDKDELKLGDDWVHIRAVVSTKGTKIYIGEGNEVAAVNAAGVNELSSFGLMTDVTGGNSFGAPPLDVGGKSLDPENRSLTPAIDIDNVKITSVEPEVETDVTISFKDEEGNKLADDVSESAIVGKGFKVAEKYLKPIAKDDDNTKYYAYKSGADDIASVVADQTIEIVFEEKAKLHYVVTGMSGETVLGSISEGYVIPGETVSALADFAKTKDGEAYVLDAESNTVAYTPTEEELNKTVNYKKVENAGIFAENFDEATDDTTGLINNRAMTIAVADNTDDKFEESINGVKAVKLTRSSTSGASTHDSVLLDLSSKTNRYGNIVLNYDSYIPSTGRMKSYVQCIGASGAAETAVEFGIRDSNGYRVDGAVNKNAENKWVHISVNADLTNGNLKYALTDAVTNAVIASGSKNIKCTEFGGLVYDAYKAADSDGDFYLDNVELVATDYMTPDSAYDFEDDETAFKVSGHAAVAAVDTTDTVVKSGKALKFTSDAETGESANAIATLDISSYLEGKMTTDTATIEYDSYVDAKNVYFGIASGDVKSVNDSSVLFTNGYSSKAGYYCINGKSGSKYTSANAQWVHTKLTYGGGNLSYKLVDEAGVTLVSETTETTAPIKTIFIASWGSDSVGYIDNILINIKGKEASVTLSSADGKTITAETTDETLQRAGLISATYGADGTLMGAEIKELVFADKAASATLTNGVSAATKLYVWDMVKQAPITLPYTAEDLDVTPVDTPSPKPTATATPGGGETPAPTATATPGGDETPAPTATATPGGDETPAPTATATPGGDETPAPTGTPAPSKPNDIAWITGSYASTYAVANKVFINGRGTGTSAMALKLAMPDEFKNMTDAQVVKSAKIVITGQSIGNKSPAGKLIASKYSLESIENASTEAYGAYEDRHIDGDYAAPSADDKIGESAEVAKVGENVIDITDYIRTLDKTTASIAIRVDAVVGTTHDLEVLTTDMPTLVIELGDKITGAVTISGTAIEGGTLTANVSGLNAGKTAVYQWQVSGDNGTWEGIERVPEAPQDTLVIPDTNYNGKQIRVVVTAEGVVGSLTSDATAAVTEREQAAGKTLTVTVKDSSDAPVEGATVTAVAQGLSTSGLLPFVINTYVTTATTNASGVAELRLATGNYTITAEKDNAVIQTGSVAIDETSTEPASAELKQTAYTVTIGGGAETVAIPAGDKYTAPAAFTASVYAGETAVTGAQVAWSVKNAPAGVSIANGVLTLTSAAQAGNVALVATYTTSDNRTITAEKTVELTAAAIASVEITGEKTAITISATEAITATYTAAAEDVYGNAMTAPEITMRAGAPAGVTFVNGTLTVPAGTTLGEGVTESDIYLEAGIAEPLDIHLTTAPTYAINSATGLTGGTVSTVRKNSAEGKVITVTVTPSKGYAIGTVTVMNGETPVATEAVEGQTGKYTFTMPSGDVNISATFSKVTYNLNNATIEADKAANGGYIAVSSETAQMGDTVTVTVTPNEGYDLSTLKFAGTTDTTVAETDIAKTDGAYTFTMPAADVTVTAVFVKHNYTVTNATADDAEGTVTVNKTNNANIGDTVTITVSDIETGYEVDTVSVKNGDADVTATAGEGGTYTFTMPAANVTVTVTFKKSSYTISNETTDTNGTVTIDKTTANYGDTVTVTVAANDKYEIDTVSVKNGEADVETTTGENGAYTFTMPAANVKVTVTFAKLPDPYVSFADGKIQGVTLESGDADKTYAQLGKSPTLSVNKAEKVTILRIDLSSIDIDNNKVNLSFRIPAQANNDSIRYCRLTSDPTADIAELTYNTVKGSFVDAAQTKWPDLGWCHKIADKLGDSTMTIDVSVDGLADDDKILYYAFGTQNGREQTFVDLALTTIPIYALNINVADIAGTDPAEKGGTVTANVTSRVEESTEVKLTITPDPGYQLKSISANGVTLADGTGDDEGKKVFTMPTNAVTINAEFEKMAGTPASLKVVYTTDGTATGKVAEATVFEADGSHMKDSTVEAAELEAYKSNVVKGAVDETTNTFKVYNVKSGLTEDVTLSAVDNVVYATVEVLDGDFYYYEDFEAGEPAEGWKGSCNSKDTYNWYYGADVGKTTKVQTGKIFGITGHSNGDASIAAPSMNITPAENEKVKVSFDCRVDLGYQSKSSNISITGDRNTAAYLNSAKQIWTLHIGAGGTAGRFGTADVNGKSVETTNFIVNSDSDGECAWRDSTGWLHLDAVIDITASKVSYTLTRKSTNTVVDSGESVAFVGADITKIDSICVATAKSFGGSYIDNIQITKVSE